MTIQNRDDFTSKIKIASNEDLTFGQFSLADDRLRGLQYFEYLRAPKDFLLFNFLQLLSMHTIIIYNNRGITIIPEIHEQCNNNIGEKAQREI